MLTPAARTLASIRRGVASRPARGGAPSAPRRSNPPLPLALAALREREPVGAVELALDLRAAAGELADVAALLRASALDLAVDARELELQALDLEHGGLRVLAPGLHDELDEQPHELRVVVCAGGHRLAEPRLAQRARGAACVLAREVLVDVDARERLRALLGRGDAEREERALGMLARGQRRA